MAKKPQKKIEDIVAEKTEVLEKKRPIFLIALVALVTVAGCIAAYFFMVSVNGAPVPQDTAASRPAYFYDLPQIVVNLNTNGGPVEFLRLSATLEYADEVQLSLIQERMPRVMDGFQVYLRELRRSDLEGSAGLYRLKQDLVRRVNLSIQPAEISDILFKDILVQ